ncbi:MAG TPA: EAL domain-containing protein [Acidiferrobacterales bacterium]
MSQNPEFAGAQRVEELERELRNREYEIALLKEIAEAVGSQLDVETVLRLVAERARALVQAETVLVPILNADCDEYTYRAGSGRHAEEIVGESLPIDYGICGWVWRQRRPWWRGMLDTLEPEERNRWEREAGSLILVPLMGKRHFLGGLAAINKAGGGDFDRRDFDLLTMFANQVSIAIENATLFDDLRRAKSKSEADHRALEILNDELADANRKLEHLALYDTLTDLPNRILIQDRLQRALLAAKRERKPVAMLMVDLDRFKEVNDTLGHNVGDELLKQVGDRLQTALREIDTIGRLGGDEFAIVVPGADPEAAVLVATKVLQALEAPFEVEGNRFFVSASVGIATYPDHGLDVSTLLKRADVAMYVAKRTKNGYFVYHASQDRHSPHRLAQLNALRVAIQDGTLALHYQPKLNLADGRITGVEALARWPYLNGEMVPPAEFVPILEQTGLIRPFAHWVLDTALGQCAAWRSAGLDLSVAVNLSMHNLRDAELPEQLAALLKKWQIGDGRLILELTEDAVMHDPEEALDMLTRIASLGVQLSIDDFGTGYSSLSYLKRLPVHEIKIDKSFVTDMSHDLNNAVIVHSMVELAHTLGLDVVAEGVETHDTLRALRDLACDTIQGFHVSRPVPAERIGRFVTTESWVAEA